jgi:hypothetical protein
MSEVHVYGVVPASAQPDLDDSGVRLIAHRDVAALVSDMERGEPRAVTVLRTHWRVLEKASASTTVLPVRFGTVMADERSVVDDFLEPWHDAIAAALAEVELLAGQGAEARRTALDRLALALEAAGLRTLAPRARVLAWSERTPEPQPMRELAAEVQRTVGAA